MSRVITASLLVVAALVSLSAAPPQQEEGASPPAKAAPAAFPATWYGVWRGTCTNVRPGGKKLMEFPMELRVASTADAARTRWVIVYGAGQRKQVRDYELVTVDAAAGHFRIDEKNSIVLDAHRVGDTLHQCFKVVSTLLHVRFTRRGDTVEIEMASFRSDTPRETGGKDRVPKVTGYPLRVVQAGVLKREDAKTTSD